jgi:hypothetical protein
MTTAEAREKLTQHGLTDDQALGVVDVLELWEQNRVVNRDYFDKRLAELKGELKADLHDSLRSLAIQFYGGVAFMLFVATVVNHYWK